MSKYVMVSFYLRSKGDYVIYGHVSASCSEKIAEMPTFKDALFECAKYRSIPMMIGCGGKVENIVRRLEIKEIEGMVE